MIITFICYFALATLPPIIIHWFYQLMKEIFLKKKLMLICIKEFFFCSHQFAQYVFFCKKMILTICIFFLLILLVLFVQMIGSWLNCGKAYDNTFCSFELLKQRLNEKNQWKKWIFLTYAKLFCLFCFLSLHNFFENDTTKCVSQSE